MPLLHSGLFPYRCLSSAPDGLCSVPSCQWNSIPHRALLSKDSKRFRPSEKSSGPRPNRDLRHSLKWSLRLGRYSPRLHQQKTTCFDKSFFVGFRSRWSLHPSVISMLGGSEFCLRNSPLRSEFTAHKRRRPEGRFAGSVHLFCQRETKKERAVLQDTARSFSSLRYVLLPSMVLRLPYKLEFSVGGCKSAGAALHIPITVCPRRGSP